MVERKTGIKVESIRSYKITMVGNIAKKSLMHSIKYMGFPGIKLHHVLHTKVEWQRG